MQYRVKSLREQAAKHNEWLTHKINNIMPKLMHEQQIDTWVVISREYNDDPALKSLLPLPMVNGDEGLIMPTTKGFMFLVFNLNQNKQFSAAMIGGPTFTNVEPYKIADYADCNEWQSLAKYLADLKVSKLGLNYSEYFSHADSLKLTELNLVKKHLPNIANKIVSAEQLCVRWLEYRTTDELQIYQDLVEISHSIIAESFSDQVVTANLTTAEDISWHMRQKINDLGLSAWFMPMVSYIRSGKIRSYKGVVKKGDILHCDMGIRYFGLLADTQQLAYILRDNESVPPLGLIKGIKQANKLQDIHFNCMKAGQTGNAILANIRQIMKEEKIEGKVWTHPIGHHGHGAGPLVGTYVNQTNVLHKGDISLAGNTCYAMELCVFCKVPEWNNELVSFNLEETIGFVTDELGQSKAVYFAERQCEFILI